MTSARQPERGRVLSLPDAFRLEGRVAIVTGASVGLGVVLVRALTPAGAHVVPGPRPF